MFLSLLLEKNEARIGASTGFNASKRKDVERHKVRFGATPSDEYCIKGWQEKRRRNRRGSHWCDTELFLTIDKTHIIL